MNQNSAAMPKGKHELVNVNGVPATGQERGELADSLDFFFDSPEQIGDSIKRTGFRSRLDP